MVVALGLASVPTTTKDHPDRLLAGGVVCGDVKQVSGGMGLHTAKLVDQRLADCPREERTDGIRIDDIRK